jgi:hypothetical protein
MVFFSTVILISIGVLIVFYKPSVITKHIVKKEPEVISPEHFPSTGEETPTPETFAKDTEPGKEETEVISSFFKKIKEGIVYHPALVLKVKGTRNGTDIHLITFSTMEWPFIRTFISDDFVVGEPEKVYLCSNGIIDVNYTVKGIWPPEIQRGRLEGHGILVTPDEKGNLNFEDFNGTCVDNGFVFTPGGELAGICFGSKFIDSEELYLSIPENCRLIYQKEEGNDGHLQGENR